jgi:hypothetical protein
VFTGRQELYKCKVTKITKEAQRSLREARMIGGGFVASGSRDQVGRPCCIINLCYTSLHLHQLQPWRLSRPLVRA